LRAHLMSVMRVVQRAHWRVTPGPFAPMSARPIALTPAVPRRVRKVTSKGSGVLGMLRAVPGAHGRDVALGQRKRFSVFSGIVELNHLGVERLRFRAQ